MKSPELYVVLLNKSSLRQLLPECKLQHTRILWQPHSPLVTALLTLAAAVSALSRSLHGNPAWMRANIAQIAAEVSDLWPEQMVHAIIT